MVERKSLSKNGRFITLEGGEGTGKSTLIKGLADALARRDIEVVVTREPGGTPLAEEIRTIALTPPDGEVWSPLAHAMLMNTSRDDHLNKLIRPSLERGSWVLCDRFADSSRAYQSIDGVEETTLLALERAVVADTSPDLTLVLDADPAALADRRQSRGTRDVFEDKDMDFHTRVRSAFLRIAEKEPERCVVLDALLTPDEILNRAVALIEARLGWP